MSKAEHIPRVLCDICFCVAKIAISFLLQLEMGFGLVSFERARERIDRGVEAQRNAF
jgi:hypothetical protein